MKPRVVNILIVDDESLVRDSLKELLTMLGYHATTAANGTQALSVLSGNTPVDIVVTDVRMPDMDGLTLLKSIRMLRSDLPVILVTGHGSIENAVEAMRAGANDYITKPIVDAEMQIIIERVIQQHSLASENQFLKQELQKTQRQEFCGIVGKSPRMQKMYTLLETIANTRSTILISGESGTGKRVVAHALHKINEQERAKPFVEVSCGALTETLLESELFGHVKGAFTGAIKDRIGRFELANGGTIFLDEIDAFSPALQVKLLRVLQEGEFERVGDTATAKVDVRVIAATNQNLEELIAQGKFRKDLYYRLNIIAINLPPLRDRMEDIPLLCETFIKIHAAILRKNVTGISKDALTQLMNYPWPGNVRELENIIERAVILTKEPIIPIQDLPESLQEALITSSTIVEPHDNHKHGLKEALQSPEKDVIVRALNASNWNRNETARALGINRTTLYKKMQKFALLKKRVTAGNQA